MRDAVGRAQRALAPAAWATFYAVVAAALWMMLASLVFLFLAERLTDPRIPALRRPVAWWWFASSWAGKGTFTELLYLAAAAMGATAPFAWLARAWWRKTGGARGMAQRVLGLYLIDRAPGHNFGAADWADLDRAARFLPLEPDPEIGGIALLEQVRMDLTPVGAEPFDPRIPEGRSTWGPGGTAPIMHEHCRTGNTAGLVVMDSGGFKTMQFVTSFFTWKTGIFCFDPSQEIGPMTAAARREMGRKVIVLDPAVRKGFNALAWIRPGEPLSEVALTVCANRTYGRTDAPAGAQGNDGAAYFRQQGLNLYTCLLGHILWHPDIPPRAKTYWLARQPLTWPEDDLRGLLKEIYETSPCKLARDLAGPLYGLVKVTFDGIVSNAAHGTAWLSIDDLAELVSGDDYDMEDLADGATVYCQIGMDELEAMPEVGRAVVSAAINTVIRRRGRVTGRVWFFIDESNLLGPMVVLQRVRDQGRKYGLTLTMTVLSEAKLEEVWGTAGARAWFAGVTWFMYGPTQDIEQAKRISEKLGSYGARTVATSHSAGSSGKPMEVGTASKGTNTTYGEMERPLLRPQEVRKLRRDERILFYPGLDPVRGRAPIAFCRDEFVHRIGETTFNAGLKRRQRQDA